MVKLAIAISGLHGSGKSTVAKALSKRLGLRLVSAGAMFRNMAHRKRKSLEELSTIAEKDARIDHFIDKKMQEEAKKGSAVLEGHLACWMTKDIADLKVYLLAPDETRLRRVAEREGTSLKEAKNILDLEKRERVRWNRLYGVNLLDLSICDLIINTEALSSSLIVKLLEDVAKELGKR